MNGIVRIVHQRERDLHKLLHPKVIKELPTLEEVLDLFNLFIKRVESLSGSDVRLAYYFSSRRDSRDKVGLVERYATEYSRSIQTRRTWAIVAYPLEGEARFVPNESFIDPSIDSWAWQLISHKKINDPLLFCRPAPQNHTSENTVFLFRQDPSNREHLDDIKSQQRLLCFPVIGPSLYLIK